MIILFHTAYQQKNEQFAQSLQQFAQFEPTGNASAVGTISPALVFPCSR